MLNVIAKVTATPDQIEAVKTGLLTVIEPTRQEEGCLSYDLHQDIKDKNIFFFLRELGQPGSPGKTPDDAAYG